MNIDNLSRTNSQLWNSEKHPLTQVKLCWLKLLIEITSETMECNRLAIHLVTRITDQCTCHRPSPNNTWSIMWQVDLMINTYHKDTAKVTHILPIGIVKITAYHLSTSVGTCVKGQSAKVTAKLFPSLLHTPSYLLPTEKHGCWRHHRELSKCP